MKSAARFSQPGREQTPSLSPARTQLSLSMLAAAAAHALLSARWLQLNGAWPTTLESVLGTLRLAPPPLAAAAGVAAALAALPGRWPWRLGRALALLGLWGFAFLP